MNIDVFQFERTVPSCVQPEVPVEIPKVWGPVVFVVMAMICGPMPD